MQAGSSQPGRAKRPWFKSTWFIVLTLIFIAPVGAVLMWLFTRWNIVVKGIATLWAFIVLLAFVAGGGGGSPQTASRAQPTAAPAQQAAAEKPSATQAAASKPVEAPKPTVAPAKPTAVPKPAEPGRGWQSPIPFQSSASIKDGDKEFRISVIEVARNATQQMKQANQFNPNPPGGMDYLLVKLTLEYLKGPQDSPFKTPSIGHSVMANARMWGPVSAVEPKPPLAGQDIFPGATVEGWLDAFIIPKDGMETVLLSYGKGIIASTGGTWFSLGEKANIPPPLSKISPSPGAADASKAGQRTAPVPFKTPAVMKDGGREIELQVTEVIRSATREIKQANQFNKDPTPGNDYILIRMKARYISGPEDRPWTTPSTGHSVFAQSRMWGTASVVEPQPVFGGIDLFPGGEHDGWLDAMELPKDGMDEAILSFGKGLLGGGDTWFALK